jgi:hypothetical protein
MMTVVSANPARFVATGLLLVCLSGCGGPVEGPEEAIRAWVKQGHELAEAKNRRALVTMISPAYTDARGNSRDDISDMFRFYFLRQNKVALITRIEELHVYDETAAELVLTVGMAGTNDGTFGFSADAYRFEMELEQGDEWLLTSARWGEFGGELR